MSWYNKILKYYQQKLWSLEMVGNAVLKSKITAQQYKEITGSDYVA